MFAYGQTPVVAAATPLGIDNAAPRLSWALEGSQRGVVQAKFQILVATSPSLLHLGRADMWAATAHTSDPFARYVGRALASQTRYYWTVRVWVHGGPPTDWSAPTWFETAYSAPVTGRAAGSPARSGSPGR